MYNMHSHRNIRDLMKPLRIFPLCLKIPEGKSAKFLKVVNNLCKRNAAYVTACMRRLMIPRRVSRVKCEQFNHRMITAPIYMSIYHWINVGMSQRTEFKNISSD